MNENEPNSEVDKSLDGLRQQRKKMVIIGGVLGGVAFGVSAYALSGGVDAASLFKLFLPSVSADILTAIGFGWRIKTMQFQEKKVMEIDSGIRKIEESSRELNKNIEDLDQLVGEFRAQGEEFDKKLTLAEDLLAARLTHDNPNSRLDNN